MSKILEAPGVIDELSEVDEILRVWIGEGDSVVSLEDLFGEDPTPWGMVLADVAIHVAKMKSQSTSHAMEATLKAIGEGYRGRMAEFHNLNYQTLSATH